MHPSSRARLLPLAICTAGALLLGAAFVGPAGRGSAQARAAAVQRRVLPQAPEGYTFLHVEYCEYCGYLKQYSQLLEALKERFGERVRMFANDPEALQEFTPEGKWRHGSFEIVELSTRKVVYTKLGTGLHVTEKRPWLEKWMDELAQTFEIES